MSDIHIVAWGWVDDGLRRGTRLLVVTSVGNGDAGEAGLPDELGMIERGALTLRLHDQGRKIPKVGAGHGGVEWCCRRNDR